MSHKIEEVITIEKTYHTSKLIHINTDLKLEVPIIVKWVSSDRTDTEYSIEYEPTQDIFEARYTYMHGNKGLHAVACEDILSILSNLGYSDLGWLRDTLMEQIDICVGKCESRYGNNVSDFDLTEYDACLTIN